MNLNITSINLQNPSQGFVCLAKDCPAADVRSSVLLKEHLNRSIKAHDASHIWFYEQNKAAIDEVLSPERMTLIVKMKSLVIKNLSKWEPYHPADNSDSTKDTEPLHKTPAAKNAPLSKQILKHYPRKERSTECDYTHSVEINLPDSNDDELHSDPCSGFESGASVECAEFPDDSNTMELYLEGDIFLQKRMDSFANKDPKRQKSSLSSLVS